jgi:recombination protein RecT
MSTEIAELLDKTESRFNQIAPQSIKYASERGFAMQLLTANPYLMSVAQQDKSSLAQAITNVAAIGLSLNPAEKYAYLIPRNIKTKDSNGRDKWVSRVYLEPSYMGLCKLATDSGSVEWIQANCVYSVDSFVDNGPGLRPDHKYNAFSKDRGDFVGVYCVAKTKTGDFLTDIMTLDDIESIRARSEAYKSFVDQNRGNGGPWVTDFNEQAKKSVVRRAFKMWPRSDMDRLAEAVHMSNENEGFEPILTSPEIKDYTAEQKSYYDQLIEQSNALEMYVFCSTIEETVKNNLYHSFEKGTKGKYQQIVNSLYNKGFSIFTDCVNSMNENAGSDESAVLEIAEDLSSDAISLMRDKLSSESIYIIEEMK